MTVKLDQLVKDAEERFFKMWMNGPTRLTWQKLPPQVGEKAPSFNIQDFNGNWIDLKEFWSEKTALILFWRHFGCGCGIDRAKRLQEEYQQYVASGAEVIIISQGEPERAKNYAEKYSIPCTILCDPEFKVYKAFGLLEGDPLLFLFDAPEELLQRDKKASEDFIKARREAGRPLVDNPWQLQGEFVIDSKGILQLAYHYQYCEDFPNPLVLTTAIKKSFRIN